MKVKKVFSLFLVVLFAFILVACGNEKQEETKKSDPLLPTSISLKVKTAKVQINKELKLTYTIQPATAQGDAVTVSLDNQKASAVVSGSNTIVLTAGSEAGTVKVTVKTSNGISASKTIKIQVEEVMSYPDLSGYNIKIAQAEQALGEYDVKLTQETKDKYGYYSAADREYKIQAWDEMEDNYNCTMTVVAYPSDAPWGPARWSYILTQAQTESPEYDFYISPNAQIPGYVAGNAIHDLTDWYQEYGKNFMNDMSYTANTYKGRLYGYSPYDTNIKITMAYNVSLFEKLQAADTTLKEPAQMYLDGEWDYDTFKEYCIKVQTALNTLYGESGESYYCLSGFGTYYWIGMVNASGIRILDTTQLKVQITGTTETAAAQTLQDIYAAGAFDPAFQVDAGVATWNLGHALFNVGSYWFLNTANRWRNDLWGEDTRYGFVPFPCSPDTEEINGAYYGITSDAGFVMAAGREWAYKGFGEECTAENIFRALLDYYATAKQYYTSSEGYDRIAAVTASASSTFGSEASVKAYLKVMVGTQQPDGSYVGGIDEYGFYDPYVGDNKVLSAWGATGTFPGDVANFIKGTGAAQWIDAIGSYQSVIEQSLVEAYG